MASIPNIGSSVTATPTETNRKGTTVKQAYAPNIDPMGRPKFVDRRRNRERRKESKRPLLDTRRNTDRRRTRRLEVTI